MSKLHSQVSQLGTVRLLAIDEDPRDLELIRAALHQKGLEVLTAKDTQRGFELFQQTHPKIVLLGPATPAATELGPLDRILAADPATSVILISKRYSADAALAATEKGACDYLTKPLDPQRLRDRVADLLAEAELRRKTFGLEQELLKTFQFEGIVSRSPVMLDIFAKIRHIAPHYRTALVTGPTGTGKELVARALHRLSPVSKNQYVVCNCPALVESLAESELFGYVRGSFTGATQDRPGLFESADGGTVFLDEVGELSLSAQAKLLRVLQDHEVRRVGSCVSRKIDFRVIAATNRDLRTMVQKGEFREDLYYRLAVVEIRLPALADRREDMPLLERYFVQKFAAQCKKPIAGLTRRAQALMATYSWPGNIREVENVIGHACMMADGQFLDIGELPERIQHQSPAHMVADDVVLSLEAVQRRHLLRILEQVGGNKAQAAEILGIARATLYQMLSKMNLEQRSKLRPTPRPGGPSYATVGPEGRAVNVQ